MGDINRGRGGEGPQHSSANNENKAAFQSQHKDSIVQRQHLQQER